MATASNSRDTSVRPPGSKYPWSEWQDGRWWTIEKGKDFDVEVKTMRDQLHVRAKSTEVKVRTHMDKVSRIVFVFQKPGETDEAFELRYEATA